MSEQALAMVLLEHAKSLGFDKFQEISKNLNEQLTNTMIDEQIKQQNKHLFINTNFVDVTHLYAHLIAANRRKASTAKTLKLLKCDLTKTQIMVVSEGKEGTEDIVRLTVNSILGDDAHTPENKDYSWEFLQHCKHAAGYGDYDACEIYPKNSDTMNAINQRHLWVFLKESNLPFIYRTEDFIQKNLEDLGLQP